MGPPASGKSTAVRQLDLKSSGLICDGVTASEGSLAKLIRSAESLGMEKITVVPVYNDIHSCLQNSLANGSATKRYNGLDQLVSAYRSQAGQLAGLHRDFPEVTIKPVDCSHNQGVRPVNYSKALSWNYKVSEKDLDKLLSAFLDAVNEGRIGMGSLRAAAGNLLSIPGLGTRGKALAGEINWRIDEILQEYIQP
jgi:hypothetical protein